MVHKTSTTGMPTATASMTMYMHTGPRLKARQCSEYTGGKAIALAKRRPPQRNPTSSAFANMWRPRKAETHLTKAPKAICTANNSTATHQTTPWDQIHRVAPTAHSMPPRRVKTHHAPLQIKLHHADTDLWKQPKECVQGEGNQMKHQLKWTQCQGRCTKTAHAEHGLIRLECTSR